MTFTQLPPAPEQAQLRVSVANLAATDAQFLRNAIALFTDPALAAHLPALRQGRICIVYEDGGALALFPFQPSRN